jgi:hypothetical protein
MQVDIIEDWILRKLKLQCKTGQPEGTEGLAKAKIAVLSGVLYCDQLLREKKAFLKAKIAVLMRPNGRIKARPRPIPEMGRSSRKLKLQCFLMNLLERGLHFQIWRREYLPQG